MKKQISAALMALMLVMQLMASGFMMPLNAIAAENAPVAENSSVSSDTDATNETSDQLIKDEPAVKDKAEAPKTDKVVNTEDKNTSSKAEAGHQEAVIDDAAEVEENKEATTEESTSEEKVLSKKEAKVAKPNSIINMVKMSIDGNVLKPNEPLNVELGKKFKIEYEFLIPVGAYSEGDQVTIDLPGNFDWESVSNSSGKVGDLGLYSITKNNQVIITFNSEIESQTGSGNIDGMIEAGFEAQSIVVSQKTTELNQSFEINKIEGKEKYDLVFSPKGTNNNLTKTGQAGTLDSSNTFRPTQKEQNAIKWTVEFNKTKNTLKNGIFKDTFDTSKLELIPGTFKAIELKYDINGKQTEGEDVTSDFTGPTNNSWNIKQNSNKAYKITYVTKIKDQFDTTFKNNASVTATGLDKSATANVNITRAALLKKTGNPSTIGANWSIEYNYGQAKISKDDAVIIDEISSEHEFNINSVKITEMKLNSSGNIVRGEQLVLNTDYRVYNTASNELQIEFNKDLDSGYLIEYSTKLVNKLIVEPVEITNTVTSKGKEASAKITNTQASLFKGYEVEKVDFQKQTATWMIDANVADIPMQNAVIKDTFKSKNMTYIPGSATVDGKEFTPTVTADGLIFDLKNITKRTIIKYDTTLDTTKLTDFINDAELTFDGGYEFEATSTIKLPAKVKANGFKSSSQSYDPKSDGYTFHWNVGFAYNLQGVPVNTTITDTFTTENMTLKKDTFKIIEVDMKNGKGTDTKGTLATSEYTLKVNEHGYVVSFPNGLPKGKAYKIVYDTKDTDDVYSISYKNKVSSILFGKNGEPGSFESEQKVANGGQGIDKDGIQARETRTMVYDVNINKSLSLLPNAVVTDSLSSKTANKNDMKFVLESFKLNDGSIKLVPTANENQAADATMHYLYISPDGNSFKIIFPTKINKAYSLKYNVYFEGDKGSVIDNSIHLSYKGEKGTLTNEVKHKVTYSNSGDAKGWGAVVYNNAFVKKVDAATGKVLKGATFKLYKEDDHETVYREAVTNEDGIAEFKNIRLKKDGSSPYLLKETEAPKNYEVSKAYKNGKIIEFSKSNQTAETGFEVENERAACEVTVSFVDAKDKEKIEKDGTYTVFTKDKVETKQKVEFKNGEAKVNLKPGTYFIKQDGDIKGFAPVDEFTEIKVEEDANGDCKVTTVNVELVKVCETVILSTDKDTGDKITANSEYKVLKDGKEFNPSVKSDDKGNIDLGKLENGEYELVQTKAPKGYVLNETPLKFTVDAEDCVANLKFENEVPKCSVTVINQDENGEVIKTDSTYKVVQGDKVIVKEVKAVDGKLTLEPLPAGDYTLVQVTADDMYVLNETGVDFTVDPKNCDGIVITNDFAKCEITVINKDENGDVITDGSTYKVMQGNEEVVETVTAVDGQIKLPALKHGTYQLVQTDVSDKYVLNKTPIEFKINKNECSATVEVINKIAKCDITVINEDVDGGKIKDGSEYDVYQIIGDEKVKVNKEPLVSKDGEVKVPALVVGKYELVQTKVDSIYVLNDKPVAFQVVKDECKVVNITNEFAKCEITVINEDENGQVITDGSEYKVMQGDKEVAKATAKDGKIVLPALKHGDYTLVQTKVSDKYVLNTTPMKFTVDKDTCNAELKFTNELAKCDITVINKDVDGGKIKDGSEYDVYQIIGDEKVKVNKEPIVSKDGEVKVPALVVGKYELVQTKVDSIYVLNDKPVAFEVVKDDCKVVNITNEFAKCEITVINKDNNGQVITDGSEYKVMQGDKEIAKATAKEGKIVLPALKHGDYTLVQTKVSDKYVLNTTPVKFTIDPKDCSATVTVVNEIAKCEITVINNDTDGKQIKNGSTYDVFKIVDGKKVKVNENPLTAKDGSVKVPALEVGKYELVQKSIEGNYVLNDKPVAFEVVKDNCATVTIVNDFGKCEVTIINKDGDTKEVITSGSEYTLYKKDKDGTKVEVSKGVKADEAGKIVLPALERGDYVLVQTKAPQNYEKAKDLEFTVNALDCSPAFEVENIMTYCPATIVLVDQELAAGIEGAKFVIKDVNGKVVGNEFTFGKDGKITTKPLRPGTYTIELVKGVPGYKIAKSTTLVISPDQCGGTISVNVDNTPNKCDVTVFNKDEKGNVIVENSTYKVEKINADGSKTVVVANVKANKGKIVLDQLRPGKYVITQTTAPKGYKLNKTPLKFEVKKDECLAELTITNGKVPPVVEGETEEVEKPTVTVPTKKPGVEVEVIDQNKKPVTSGKTDGKGNVVIEKLPPGKYEVVDKDKNVITTIIVDKNGNVLPQTGESNSLAYGLGGLLVIALGAFMVIRNRRKHA